MPASRAILVRLINWYVLTTSRNWSLTDFSAI
jgi:hypothetical protein